VSQQICVLTVLCKNTAVMPLLLSDKSVPPHQERKHHLLVAPLLDGHGVVGARGAATPERSITRARLSLSQSQPRKRAIPGERRRGKRRG